MARPDVATYRHTPLLKEIEPAPERDQAAIGEAKAP